MRIPLKAISDSEAKPIKIPDGNRSDVGAKRRWFLDVAKTDRDRQVEFVRSDLSEAKRRKDGRGEDGVWGKGHQSLTPPQHTLTPERESASAY